MSKSVHNTTNMNDSGSVFEREYYLLLVNADNLRALRHERELDQADLAEKAGLSRRTIIYIENGKTKPTKTTLRKIETALISEDPDLIEFVKTIWIDDMLEYFYCYFGFDMFHTARKISNRMLKEEIDANSICRKIVEIYGPWVDGFMPPERTQWLCTAEAQYPYIIELLLLSRVFKIKMSELFRLRDDWRVMIKNMKVALQKAQVAGTEWDLLLNARLARLHKQESSARVITVQPRDVEEALDQWLRFTDLYEDFLPR